MKEDTHSSTALMIARSTFMAGFDPVLKGILSQDAAAVSEWFVEDHANDSTRLRKRWYRLLLQGLQYWILPGIQLHYLLRKRVIEEQVRRAIDCGTRQVVVVAGGFDTLAYRLHSQYPNVRFVEFDHPATQRSKRRSLFEHGTPGSNLRLHPVDLTKTSLQTALSEVRVDPNLATIVLAEGLLMYLEPAQVEQLVATVAQYFRSTLYAGFSFMVPDTHGRSRFHNANWLLGVWLSWKQERFLSAFTHQDFRALLSRFGFDSYEFWDHARMKHEGLPASKQGLTSAQGEHLCFAVRAVAR